MQDSGLDYLSRMKSLKQLLPARGAAETQSWANLRKRSKGAAIGRALAVDNELSELLVGV
jgi:uncharacterized protein YfiM (DUF2279 family)